jgi:hypothetical protein
MISEQKFLPFWKKMSTCAACTMCSFSSSAFEGLGEMFEGDSADMCAGKFPLMLLEDKRTVKCAQKVSEDPHRCERKFNINGSWNQNLSILKFDPFSTES